MDTNSTASFSMPATSPPPNSQASATVASPQFIAIPQPTQPAKASPSLAPSNLTAAASASSSQTPDPAQSNFLDRGAAQISHAPVSVPVSSLSPLATAEEGKSSANLFNPSAATQPATPDSATRDLATRDSATPDSTRALDSVRPDADTSESANIPVKIPDSVLLSRISLTASQSVENGKSSANLFSASPATLHVATSDSATRDSATPVATPAIGSARPDAETPEPANSPDKIPVKIPDSVLLSKTSMAAPAAEAPPGPEAPDAKAPQVDVSGTDAPASGASSASRLSSAAPLAPILPSPAAHPGSFTDETVALPHLSPAASANLADAAIPTQSQTAGTQEKTPLVASAPTTTKSKGESTARSDGNPRVASLTDSLPPTSDTGENVPAELVATSSSNPAVTNASADPQRPAPLSVGSFADPANASAAPGSPGSFSTFATDSFASSGDSKISADTAPKVAESNSASAAAAGPVASTSSKLAAPSTLLSPSATPAGDLTTPAAGSASAVVPASTSSIADPAPSAKSASSAELPPAHQMLDSAVVPPASDPASQAINPALPDPGALQMHFGIHTNAFGNVEIHTIVEQSQVGVAIHGDRDLARWFNSEMGGLESGLKSQHMNLTGVDFSSNRSGVQTATGFQQGQPRQDFSQRQSSYNPASPSGESAPQPAIEPELTAASPVLGTETRVSILA